MAIRKPPREKIVATYKPRPGLLALPVMFIRVEPPRSATSHYDIVAYPGREDDPCVPLLGAEWFRWENAALDHPVPMVPRLKVIEGITYIAMGIDDNGQLLGLMPRGVQP